MSGGGGRAAGEPRQASRDRAREHDRVLDEYREFVDTYGRPSGDAGAETDREQD